MTDTTLRALERAASTGDDETRARWLIARIRAGTLTLDRVGLAAYAGNKAAQLACGCCCDRSIINRRIDCWAHSADQFSPVCSVRWIYELACWGLDVVVRVALVVAREVLGDWPNIKPGPGDAMGAACLAEAREELRVIELGETWLADRNTETHFAWWLASKALIGRDDSGWDYFFRISAIPEDAPTLTAAFIGWAVQTNRCSNAGLRDKVGSALSEWALGESHE